MVSDRRRLVAGVSLQTLLKRSRRVGGGAPDLCAENTFWGSSSINARKLYTYCR
jgi:hypothetical protein